MKRITLLITSIIIISGLVGCTGASQDKTEISKVEKEVETVGQLASGVDEVETIGQESNTSGEPTTILTRKQEEMNANEISESVDLFAEEKNKELGLKEGNSLFSFEGKVIGSLEVKSLILTPDEDPTTTVNMTFQLHEKVEELSILVLNEIGELLHEYKIGPNDISQTVDNQGESVYVYKLSMKELLPGTKYQYMIWDQKKYSQIYTFSTLKREGLTLAFFGDTQGYTYKQYEAFRKTYNYALAESKGHVDLSYIAGDIVDNGEDLNQWNYFYEAMKEPLATSLFITTIGNHDVKGTDEYYVKSFNYPDNGIEGLKERNYYIQLPEVTIAVWDTESPKRFDEQGEWLSKVMSESQSKYKVVLMHRSVYPMAYDEAYIRVLSEFFDEAGIDLVLSGHDHIYNRTIMDDTTYIVGGSSSGSKYYSGIDIKERPWKQVIYDENNPVFTLVEVKKGVLEIHAYGIIDNNSVLIDSLKIQK